MPGLRLVLLGLICSGAAHAANISADHYTYTYGDAVKAVEGEAFVVCGNCKPDYLKKLPVRQIVAIKINPATTRDVVEPPPPIMAGGGTTMATDSSMGSHKKMSAMGADVVGAILFDFDSATISAVAKKQLDELIRTVPVGVRVDLEGYACTTGSTQYNLELSKRRAQSVEKYLSEKGILIGDVIGKGECCNVSDNKKLNRRVEVKKGEKN